MVNIETVKIQYKDFNELDDILYNLYNNGFRVIHFREKEYISGYIATITFKIEQ